MLKNYFKTAWSSYRFRKKLLIVICFLAANCALAQTVNDANKDSINKVIEKEANIFLNTKGAVGISVGIIKNDKFYNCNYGSVEKEHKKKPTSKTIFSIASISKTFTGLLLAMAVNENKVSLDNDIRKYLAGDYPNLQYAGQPIRLYHLISHVSRLPFFLSDSAEKIGYSRADFYRDLHNIKLDTIPGIKFKYSNAAAQLLGFILEDIYHKSYEELLETKICYPLKMADTKISLSSSDKTHTAKRYNADGEYNSQTYDYLQAAGGLKSTSADLLKYVQLQMNEKDSSVMLSHKESWGFDIDSSKRYSFSLGWQIVKNKDGLQRISQDGNLANSTCVIIFCPELKAGVVILSNTYLPDAASTMANNILKQIEPRMQ